MSRVVTSSGTINYGLVWGGCGAKVKYIPPFGSSQQEVEKKSMSKASTGMAANEKREHQARDVFRDVG